MLITEYEYAGSDYTDGIVHDYSRETSYYACDCCGDMESTLYRDGKKQLCAKCVAENNMDDFIKTYYEEILEKFAKDYVEGYEIVQNE